MEKKFYNDTFERLLKEKLDDFRMLPSKKSWHSIYNDLHPGKKWPSITISLVLISAIGLLGYFNTSSHNTQYAAPQIKLAVEQRFTKKSAADKIKTTNSLNRNTAEILPVNNHLLSKNTIAKNENGNLRSNISDITANKIEEKSSNKNNLPNYFAHGKSNDYTPAIVEKENISTAQINNELAVEIKNNAPVISLLTAEQKETLSSTTGNIPAANNVNNTANKKINKLADSDRAWIDNYALYNRPQKNMRKGRVSYEIYATPNVNFRKLSVKTKYNTYNENNFDQLNQQPSFGIETGLSAIYSMTKNIRLKTGLQFNYTSYAITALETNHPVLTTLTMKGTNADYVYLEPRASTISNMSNSQSSKLHNNTYQLSIPLGVEYKLAGKDQVQWYASANIQPTYLLGGNAYLISSDTKNYVKDPSLIRKYNINTAWETFISYKTKNNIRVQLGPQYRYQLLSTYKGYSVSENLYHLGVKFGVVKKF